MNILGIIILAALLLESALNITADILNLRSSRSKPPPGLEGIYDPGEYSRSQQYLRERTRLDMLAGIFSLFVVLAFWFSGGFDWLDQVVRQWSGSTLLNGMAYIGILGLARALLNLPFGLYATFVVEERFGFNRTSPRTFILDQVKGLVLLLVLGGPLLAGILALFIYAGDFAWLYCWAAVTAFTLVMQYIAPVWIMPLFNKFTPLQDEELKNAILEYARSVNFPVRNVLVMDGSRRSSKSNAFFTGFGANKRIALFDTLIEKHTRQELIAVLAHEIGHYRKKHILQGMIVGIAHTGIMLFLLSLALNSDELYPAFFIQQAPVYAGLVFFGILAGPFELILSAGLLELSRHNEYAADRFAVETTGDGSNLAVAMRKLAAHNLANLTPHPFYVMLNYSHPPLLQRLKAIESVRQKDPSA